MGDSSHYKQDTATGYLVSGKCQVVELSGVRYQVSGGWVVRCQVSVGRVGMCYVSGIKCQVVEVSGVKCQVTGD